MVAMERGAGEGTAKLEKKQRKKASGGTKEKKPGGKRERKRAPFRIIIKGKSGRKSEEGEQGHKIEKGK